MIGGTRENRLGWRTVYEHKVPILEVVGDEMGEDLRVWLDCAHQIVREVEPRWYVCECAVGTEVVDSVLRI